MILAYIVSYERTLNLEETLLDGESTRRLSDTVFQTYKKFS